MTYLVTGGAGFIGSNIVKELLRIGHSVKVLDNFLTGKRDNIRDFVVSQRFELIEGDLRDLAVVRSAVRGVEYVLHQGALPSVPRSIKDPVTTNEINVLGTLNVLEASREYRVRRVVYASSSSVYGNSEMLPKVEDMPVQPLSPYAVSKYAGERYFQIFHQIYGLETVCLRYFNVFGPNQDPTSQYSAVIPKFITLMRQGKQPVIFGDGLQSRDFTFVENNVRANLLACEAKGVGGGVFNIACGGRYTLRQLVKSINTIMGTHIEPLFDNERGGDVKHSLASIDKAKKLLSYTPGINFEDGLKRTIEYFH